MLKEYLKKKMTVQMHYLNIKNEVKCMLISPFHRKLLQFSKDRPSSSYFVSLLKYSQFSLSHTPSLTGKLCNQAFCEMPKKSSIFFQNPLFTWAFYITCLKYFRQIVNMIFIALIHLE